MYKVIVFDLDGTLADTDFMVIDAFLELFKKYRPDYKPSLDELALLSGPTLSDSMDKYFPLEDKNKLIEEFKKISAPMYVTHTQLYDGVFEMLFELKKQNYKLAILTNKAHEATRNAISLYNSNEIFDKVISSDDIKNPKPSPEGLDILQDIFKVNKSEMLFVGDSQIDSLTAKNAQVKCVLVTWNLRGKLEGVEADYFVSKISELKEVIKNG